MKRPRKFKLISEVSDVNATFLSVCFADSSGDSYDRNLMRCELSTSVLLGLGMLERQKLRESFDVSWNLLEFQSVKHFAISSDEF